MCEVCYDEIEDWRTVSCVPPATGANKKGGSRTKDADYGIRLPAHRRTSIAVRRSLDRLGNALVKMLGETVIACVTAALCTTVCITMCICVGGGGWFNSLEEKIYGAVSM